MLGRRNVLAEFAELSRARANFPKPLFDFNLLRAGIVLQKLDAVLLRFDIATQVCILQFKSLDLLALLQPSADSLRSSKRDDRV